MLNEGIQVTRKSHAEYMEIKRLITEYMAAHGHIMHYARETPGKTDYGDLDAIYVTSPTHNMRAFIETHFQPPKIATSGGQCMSFVVTTDILPPGLRDFQIDFIGIRADELESELFYRSYGDLGNILGRVTSFYGVKFGGQGLWVNYEYTTTMGKQAQCHITLSKNPAEICQFLGLDFAAWLEGFGGSEQAMFAWIQSSNWFTQDAFRLLNTEYRHRTKKRPGYNRFMEFIHIAVSEVTQAGNENPADTRKRWRQHEAVEHFGKLAELEDGKRVQELADLRQTKFNGSMFVTRKVPPKEIGKRMREFQVHTVGDPVSEQVWFAWLDAQPDPNTVDRMVGDFLQSQN